MDIGMPELIVIMLVALILFGGKKLPEVGGSIGSATREFKNAMRDATNIAELTPTNLAKAKSETKKQNA